MRVLLLLMVLSLPLVATAQAPLPKVKVVVIADGASPTLDDWFDELRKETLHQLADRYAVDFPERPLEGDWTLESVERLLDTAYADPDVRVVFGLGSFVASAVAGRNRLPKTTILPFVIEGQQLRLPRRGYVSGRKNLSYITEGFDVSGDLDQLKRITDAKRVAVLVESRQETNARKILEGYEGDVQIAVAVVESDGALVLTTIPKDVDSVVIGSMQRLDLAQRKRLLEHLMQRRLPSSAVGGASWVEEGALMTLRSPTDLPRRAQRAALNLDLILGGRAASELHVDFESRQDLLINLAVARALRLRLTLTVLSDANIINEGVAPRSEDRIGLRDAMEEARRNNLRLAAASKFVEAGEENVKATRGPLLPQGQLGASLVLRDPDRVFAASQFAQRQANWSARAQQTLYSETAWTRFRAQQYRQAARVFGLETDQLDVMLEAGVAFVTVLRASAFERIQRGNLNRTREYLDLAKLRQEVGIANASETYRWEIELADNQKAVVDARALINQSKIELNRVLNRPSEQAISPVDLPYNREDQLEAPNDPIGPYLTDPWSFRQLREFLVRRGLQNSPEAKAVDEQKRAQERVYEGRGRQLWLPDFFVDGGVVNDFWRDGKGTEGIPGFDLPEPDKFGWDVGLFLAIPLSTGGTQVAELKRSARLYERLEEEYARIRQEIDTSIRTELYTASAASAGVSFTRQAADAAANNLRLVTDLYQQGTVDIITLVDAQTQSLLAELDSVDAVYNYLLSLLFVDRSMGRFRNLDTPEEQKAFTDALNAFLMAAEAEFQPIGPAP